MASEEQVKANRENAKKSTGPKTEEGKEKVAQNAVTHGLCARAVLLWNENPAEWDAMREDILAESRTGSSIEKVLLGRVALYAWRLRRAARVEREMMENEVYDPIWVEVNQIVGDEDGLPFDEERTTLGGKLNERMKEDAGWSRFARYEGMLQRGLYGAMRELRLFRKLALEEAKSDANCWGPDTDKLVRQYEDEARRHAALMAAESRAAEERLARSIDRGQGVCPPVAADASPCADDGKEEIQNKANFAPEAMAGRPDSPDPVLPHGACSEAAPARGARSGSAAGDLRNKANSRPARKVKKVRKAKRARRAKPARARR